MFHILLVEDNPSDVLLIREAIRTSSISADVTVAYDGAEAMQLLNALDTPMDLVILDLNLPRFGGLEILERSRVEGRPPVIVFTGSNNPAERDRALALGAKEHIVKPVAFEEYTNTIAEAIMRWMPQSRFDSVGCR